MTRCKNFEFNFYLDKKIVHIEKRMYASTERIALKWALMHYIPKDLKFDMVRCFRC